MFTAAAFQALEEWPHTLLGSAATFLREGYQYTTRDNRQFSKMSSGPELSRLVSRTLVSDVTGQLALTEGELLYFEWWYLNKINYGNDWFKIQLMTPAGLNTVAAKFTKSGKGAPTRRGIKHTVRCKLMTVGSPIDQFSEQEIIDLISIGPFKLQSSIKELYAIVNEEW